MPLKAGAGSGGKHTPKIDVKHVARLAMLKLEDGEAEKMQRELQSILEHMEELFSLDVKGVEPSFGSFDGAELRLFPDEVRAGLCRNEFLRGVPAVRDSYVMVPRTGQEQGSPRKNNEIEGEWRARDGR
ncbi:MAG TPA: Asp-tRNA(Asn)/Glu-tRNA(Gln) amidotransferase subunit GatC [Firmicutes bacterium]|nr:Asp-tRNA(Asn)/Glu-tRNA(Gln) amidotransferase subunit GatC [Candidatus Fermentithermobacillaceae bacterium]